MLELRLDVLRGGGGGGRGGRGYRGYREARRTPYVRRVRGRATSWRRAGGRRQNGGGGAAAGIVLQLQAQLARLALLLGLLPSERDLKQFVRRLRRQGGADKSRRTR